jgi:hypothetical protein
MSSDEIQYSRIPDIRKIGRPKKFESVEQLEDAIQEYFNSCFMPKMRQVKIKTGDEVEYIDEQVLDTNGDPVFIQIQPFTITGLAISLGTTRETLLDYENKQENAAFSDTIKMAKQRIQQYAENYLYTGKNPTGAIFNLKNNYGWVDRRETDLTTKGDKIQSGVIESKAADILKDD